MQPHAEAQPPPDPGSATPNPETTKKAIGEIEAVLEAKRQARREEFAEDEPKRLKPINRLAKAGDGPARAQPEVPQDPLLRQRQEWERLAGMLGPRYANCRLHNFHVGNEAQRAVVDALTAYAANLGDEVRQGNGIVLFGPTGTGKDHLLAGLARAAILKHGIDVNWTNTGEFFAEMREQIGSDASEMPVVRRLARPTILVLSDPVPPSGSLGDFQRATLFRVLDRRYRHYRPTWTTMNVRNRREADEAMGPALVDRLQHGALVCYCSWETYRKPRVVGSPEKAMQRQQKGLD